MIIRNINKNIFTITLALKCIKNMQLTSFTSNSIIIVKKKDVCATILTLKWDMHIHGKIIKCVFLSYEIMIKPIKKCMQNIIALRLQGISLTRSIFERLYA